jgi:hypothetical protein
MGTLGERGEGKAEEIEGKIKLSMSTTSDGRLSENADGRQR